METTHYTHSTMALHIIKLTGRLKILSSTLPISAKFRENVGFALEENFMVFIFAVGLDMS